MYFYSISCLWIGLSGPLKQLTPRSLLCSLITLCILFSYHLCRGFKSRPPGSQALPKTFFLSLSAGYKVLLHVFWRHWLTSPVIPTEDARLCLDFESIFKTNGCWWKWLLSNAILCTICNLNGWSLTCFDKINWLSSFGVVFLHLFKAHALSRCQPPSCPAAYLVSAPLCSSVLCRPLVAWKQHWQLQLLTFSGAVKDAPPLSSEEEVRENHARNFWPRLKPWMLNYCQRCINDAHKKPGSDRYFPRTQKSHDHGDDRKYSSTSCLSMGLDDTRNTQRRYYELPAGVAKWDLTTHEVIC